MFDRQSESAASVIVHHTTNRTLGQLLYRPSVQRCTYLFDSGLTCTITRLKYRCISFKLVDLLQSYTETGISPPELKQHCVR